MKKTNRREKLILRKNAEDILKDRMPDPLVNLQDSELLKLKHELEVGKIELELQQKELTELIDKLLESQKELKESNENLLISEGDLKKAQSVARLGNWKWNVKTGEVVWSEEMYNIFGISKDSFTGRLGDVISSVIHPDDLYLVLPSNAGSFTDKKTIEYRIVLPDKTIRYISAESGESILDGEGNPVFLTGIAQDITARKLTEENLKKSQEELLSANNQLVMAQKIGHTGSWTYDLKTDTVWGSDEARRLFGLDGAGDKFTLESIEACIPDRERVHEALINLLKEDKPYDLEMVVNPADGSESRIVISKAVVEKNIEGSPLHIIGIIQDVTELRQAEQSLKVFKTVIECSDEAISIANPIGELQYTNPAHDLLFGRLITEKEIHTYRDFFTRESNSFLEKEAIPLLQDGVNWQGELEAVDVTGRKLPIWSSLGTIWDDSGRMLNCFAFSHDISGRVMMENEVKKQKELYRLITERTNDLIFIYRLKPDSGFEYVSPSSEMITGYTPEDHYNDPLLGLKLIHPDDRHIIQSMLEGHFGSGILKLRWIKKDGSIIWTEQRIVLIYDENGEVAAIQGNATDITERIHSEQILEARLRISEYSIIHTKDQVQRYLLDELEKLTHSNIGFFHVVESDQKRLLLQCWSTSTLANMCRAEVKEKHYNIADAGVWAECFYVKKPVIHNDYKSMPLKKGLPVGHSEILRELVVPVLRNDKVMAMIGIGNKPTDYNNRDIEIVSLLADMTWDIVERKATEEELHKLNAELELRVEERTVQLTAAYKQMESFAYSVSHDLNTPLRHIKGFAEILMEINPGQRSPEEHKCINTISESADDMGKLIEALLLFSKFNHVELKKNSINTSLLVNNVIRILETEIPGRKINFKVGDLTDCAGDEQLVKQVWINLISNAIKYTGKKHTAIIEIGNTDNQKETIYFVRDNGVGFDMKYAQKLFGVFQRFHNKSDFPGVGIGLANVNSIVTRHGGRCFAESKVNNGATFYFSLPKVYSLHR